MTDRLNKVIAALESGGRAFGSFVAPEVHAAIEFSTTNYDGLVFEAEHRPWDALVLRDCLQYLLNRRQILESDSLAPAVTPLVRIPPNGAEMAQWHAKQALDLGFFGIVWPHITSVAEAANAVAACQYPPAGVRGDGPTAAARYWGVSNQDYYRSAGVWGIDPEGEILVAIMIEDVAGVQNLPQILDEVPGIGLVLIGEGDLSQELGHPRQYEHPDVLAHKARVLEACLARGVAVGHPHVTTANVDEVIEDGYRFLMSMPVRTYPVLEKCRQPIGRN
jgi:4-hydroxy-2-oxoheptanedioate aldolase